MAESTSAGKVASPYTIPRCSVILANKGGVGKTTTGIALAGAVAAAGGNVLFIDLDQQMNSTQQLMGSMSYEPRNDPREPLTVFDVIKGAAEGVARDAIIESYWTSQTSLGGDSGARIDVILGDPSLDADSFLDDNGQPAIDRLSLALSGGVAEDYDLILIDTPPSRSRIQQAALLASVNALVISATATMSMKGLQQTLEFSDLFAASNPGTGTVAGIIASDFDRRLDEDRQCLDEISTTFPQLLWQPAVPHRVVVKASQARCWPLAIYPDRQADGPGRVYQKLAGDLLRTFGDPRLGRLANRLGGNTITLQDLEPNDDVVIDAREPLSFATEGAS